MTRDEGSGPADSSARAGSTTISTPQTVDIERLRNVTDLLRTRLNSDPDHLAFEVQHPGRPISDPWQPISTAAFAREVDGVARGLIARGLQAGDTVVIMAATQYRWAVVDQAALHAGAIVVPIYDTSGPERLAAILADARPRAAFAGTEEIAQRIGAASVETPEVWTLDESGPEPRTAAGDLDDLRAAGAEVSAEALEERRLSAGLDDTATIVYTSGTTGEPKGALITHRNLVGQVLGTGDAYADVVRSDGSTILFLPLTHVLGRALQLICIANGMRVAHLADPKEVVGALSVLRPTFLVVVPRVLEKIQHAAASSAETKRLGRVWRSAVATAVSWGEHLQTVDRSPGTRASAGLRLRHRVFDRLFFGRLRGVMGGRISFLLSGAATLRPDLALFFRGIGVPVIEGYGLTETTAPLTGGRPGSLVAGTVGTPLPGNSVMISEDGEVLGRGVGVFAGYRRPEHQEGAFVDGWFRTGDQGRIDADGQLILTGRRDDVIITSTGRTINPTRWETRVEREPLVAHAAMIGTDRPHPAALLVVDAEAVQAHCGERERELPPELSSPGLVEVSDPEILRVLEEAVTAAGAQEPPALRVRSWRALSIGPEVADELITPTMKLRRRPLLERAGDIVDALYR